MKYELVNEFPNAILFEEVGPFISLYQTTHRHSPENIQDPIVFKNLVVKLENTLLEQYDKRFTEKFLEPFYEIQEDKDFWVHSKEGLGVLANQNRCVVYQLNHNVPETAAVSEHFYLKPLIENFQMDQEYMALILSSQDFALYLGNLEQLIKVKLPHGTATTQEELLGDQFTEKYTDQRTGDNGRSTVTHGQGGRRDEIEKDNIKFFRYVDEFVYENYSKNNALPVILVALEENEGEFRKISDNTYLLEEGIRRSFEEEDLPKVKELAAQMMKDRYFEKIRQITERYSNSSGSDNLSQIGFAAFEKKIDTLFLREGAKYAGRFNFETGEVIEGEEATLGYSDIFDDIAESVLLSRGKVFILPEDKMPTMSPIAAIFRY